MIKSVGFICFIFKLLLSVNCQCNEHRFIAISRTNVFLLNYDSLTSIYQTNSNQTIEFGVIHPKTNTVFLLINQLNVNYQIRTLNPPENIYTNWIEKSSDLVFSSSVSLSIGQRYFYVLDNQLYLLKIYSLPLTSSSTKDISLRNVPKNGKIFKYLIDETYQLMWILFQSNPYRMYICQLETSQCYLYTNIMNFDTPEQFFIQWHTQQIYLYSKQYLILFDYNQTQTIYSIHYLNSTANDYLIVCEKSNTIEYLSLKNLSLPTAFHSIERFPLGINRSRCTKQRSLSKIIIIILILIDLGLTTAMLIWLTIRYLARSKETHTITTEKDSITYF